MVGSVHALCNQGPTCKCGKPFRNHIICLSVRLSSCLSVRPSVSTPKFVGKHFRCDMLTQIILSYIFQILYNNILQQQGKAGRFLDHTFQSVYLYVDIFACNNFCLFKQCQRETIQLILRCGIFLHKVCSYTVIDFNKNALK